MAPLQAIQLQRLIDADHAGRLRVCYPQLPGKDDQLMLHSKLTIIDDEVLHLRSANFNDRSMEVDHELDFTVFARNEKERQAIAQVPHRLLAEHIGVSVEDILNHGTPEELFALLDQCDEAERALKSYPVADENAGTSTTGRWRVFRSTLALRSQRIEDVEHELKGHSETIACALMGTGEKSNGSSLNG